MTLSDEIFESMEYGKIAEASDIKSAIDKLTPKLFHIIYEEMAMDLGWETNKKCRVKYDDLPQLNKQTMIKTIEFIKKAIFGAELTEKGVGKQGGINGEL